MAVPTGEAYPLTVCEVEVQVKSVRWSLMDELPFDAADECKMAFAWQRSPQLLIQPYLLQVRGVALFMTFLQDSQLQWGLVHL